MFDSGNYGCAVVVMCDVRFGNPVASYAGFTVVRVDDNKEIARFYEGDPQEDYETASAYAYSIASRVSKSSLIEQFWKKTGIKAPREVRL